MKTVLVLGATGAMGRYLVPELTSLGYTVTGVGLEETAPWSVNADYIQGNAFDKAFLAQLLKKGFDGIVNFMDYGSNPFSDYYRLFLENTKHYIFLSTCRVYDDLAASFGLFDRRGAESISRLLHSQSAGRGFAFRISL